MDYEFDEIDKKWFEECAKNPDQYVIREVFNGYECRLDYQVINDFTGEILHVFSKHSENFAKQVLNYCGCSIVEE